MEEAIDKQIAAAQKQLRLMKNQNRKLEETIQDLEFSLEELGYEQEIMDDGITEESQNVCAETYFEYLGFVEECEEALKNHIKENQTKLQTTTSYKQRLLLQNKALEKKVQIRCDRLSNLVTENRAISDELNNLELLLEEKKLHHADIAGSVDSMAKESLEQKSESGLSLQELHETNVRLRNELELRKKELYNANSAIKRCEEDSQKRKNAFEREIQACQSIKSWEGQRKMLNGKLKDARKKLSSAIDLLNSATKKDAKLGEELLSLTGGDETGLRAKQMLECEITSAKSFQVTSFIDIEQNYSEELLKRLSLITQTRSDLEQYRSETLGALQKELDASEQRGYLAMLRDEVNAAKHSVYVRC